MRFATMACSVTPNALVVSVTSKIRILKAIHNLHRLVVLPRCVVSVTSKIRILKAIHNCQIPILKILRVVSVTSKIRILKAIHNYLHRRNFIIVLFP